jgi:thioester reductase-like protein
MGSELYTRLPIGKPIDNVAALLLDDDLNLVPHGVIGQIHMGGACVGSGYLNDPAKTRTVFLDNPYPEVASSHIYRTGDLAYHLPDGNIQFVGRRDAQVKLRGVRIELGEIESTLLKHSEVQEARVLLDKRVAGREELVGYIVAKAGRVDVRSVKEHLRREVPDYMVPTQFVVLDAFPLDHNGKVDRKRLLQDFAPEATKTLPDDPFCPQTARETTLAEVWKETLQLHSIDKSDTFFDLGGNSLLGVRLICGIQETLGIEISIHDLYRHPTIGELSKAIDAAAAGGAATSGAAAGGPAPVQEIEQDLHCPDEIRGDGSARAAAAEFTHVLLTGATGFVGAHLLHELLESTDAAVYCLVRAQGEVGALIRIRENLKYYGLDAEKHLSRIVPVPGDLSRPRFDLSTDNYRDLAQRTDAVFHCGAMVDYLRDYRGHRAANVLGTLEVLRFATTQQTKIVHHISTLGVLPLQDPSLNGQVFPEGVLDRQQLPEGGYSQSKWAAEQLVYAARERGVPCIVYRLGEVMPDTLLGVPNRKAMTHMMMSGLLALRMVPQTDAVIDYLPADYVRRAVVHIARQPRWLGSTFNLRHATGVPLSRILEIFRSVGFQLEEVPYATFWRSLQEAGRAGGADDSLLLLKSMMASGFEKQEGERPLAKDVLRELFYMDADRVVDRNATRAIEGSGITLPDDLSQLVRPYALYCKQLA